jgi:cell division protein FtsB
MLQRIPKLLKNRYILTTAAFILWVSFFDRNDLFTQAERARDLRTLQKSKAFYTTQIDAAKKELDLMTNDPSALEKFAREKYRMKKDNEDEFAIDDAPSKNAQ